MRRPGIIRCTWRDGVLVPEPYYARWCEDNFGEGEVIQLERAEDRSTASHNHYFATIKECWDNLPESEHERFPTPDRLRTWALIRSGYYHEKHMVCTDADQANQIAAFIPSDDNTIIVVRDNIIKRYTAKSQSNKAMNKEEFQRSKVDVLDTIAELIRVKRSELEKNAGRAA